MNNFNGKVFGNPLVTPINTYTKKQTETLINKTLGDIETVLDNIIAIQETHIIQGVNVATEDGDSV